ncbi:alpha/beta hydrolase-fold protein [Spongiimicrobium salis]|uniref:alpha/beta hydrolase-fold protein n=1 Tax=Spongiimicrobium salis TaxID=1667022 RepID=UPI00374D0A8F
MHPFKIVQQSSKIIYSTVLLALLCMPVGLLAQKEAGKIVIGSAYTMTSKVLKEERTYIVGLPDSYHDTKNSYPVLVLLDGEVRFHSHSGIINQMARGRQVPEMIIVAITNVDRVRDYTPSKYLVNLNGSSAVRNHSTSGGSAAFLRFIEEELLPEIDKNYRTNAYRTLVGISHGGLLVGSSYLSPQSSFDAYVSMDPSFWWDNQLIVKQIDQVPLAQLAGKKFYLSTADNYKNFERIPHVFKANINSHELFNAKLKNKGVDPAHIQFDYFKEENHWTVALLSLYQGLQFIFKDLQQPALHTASLEEIITQYKAMYNGKFTPPEHMINALGYRLISQKQHNKALQAFLWNTEHYPNSWNAFDSLGEMYKIMGDSQKAIKNYQASLQLNPDNKNAVQMLKVLKNKH